MPFKFAFRTQIVVVRVNRATPAAQYIEATGIIFFFFAPGIVLRMIINAAKASTAASVRIIVSFHAFVDYHE